MVTISILQGRSPAHQLINGVFGRYDGEKFHIAHSLQRIYLMSLQSSIPVKAENVFSLDVADEHENAIQANLVSMLRQHWRRLYEARAPMAGMMEGMLRAEQQQVSAHCEAIISDLDVQEPIETAVLLRSHVVQPDADDDADDETGSQIVSVQVRHLLGNVDMAAIYETTTDGQADQSSVPNEGLESIDMNLDRSYDVNIKMTLPLYGSERARAVFVEQFLPALAGSGLYDEVPVRAVSYHEAREDTESPRFGSA